MEIKGEKIRLNIGDICWILENNSYAVSGTVKSISGGKSHRVYATREEAEEQIIRHKGSNAPRSPYDYWY